MLAFDGKKWGAKVQGSKDADGDNRKRSFNLESGEISKEKIPHKHLNSSKKMIATTCMHKLLLKYYLISFLPVHFWWSTLVEFNILPNLGHYFRQFIIRMGEIGQTKNRHIIAAFYHANHGPVNFLGCIRFYGVF